MEKENFPKNIYLYDDYRLFLKDYFLWIKQQKSQFSYRYFAGKAGFKSAGFINNVIAGRKNLSGKSAKKISQGLQFGSSETEFFEILVGFCQAKKIEEKEVYFKKMHSIRKKSSHYKLNIDQYILFEQWYYPVVLQLATNTNWHNSYSVLASMVSPRITAKMAENCLEKLIGAGLVIAKDGKITKAVSQRFSNSEVPVSIKAKSRKEILEKLVESTEVVQPEHRHITYDTVAISEKTYLKIVDKLEYVRKEIAKMVLEDDNFENVYEIVLSAFPLTNTNLNHRGEK